MKIKDLKIRTQLLVSFVAMLAFIVILGLVSYRQANKIQQQTKLIYDHPVKIRRVIGLLDDDIMNIRVKMRDLLLQKSVNEKLSLIQEINVSGNDTRVQFNAMRSQYLGQKKDIEEAAMAFTRWFTAYEENIQLANANQHATVIYNLSDRGPTGILNAEMMQKLKVIDDFALNKSESLYLNSQRITKDLKNQLLFIIVSIFILMLIVNYFLIRNIQNPIKELSDVTNQFRDGNLNVRSRIDSKNEFGSLSSSFNTMVEVIQTTTELNERTAALSELMLLEEEPKPFFISILPALAAHTNSQMAAVYILSEDKKRYNHFHSFGMESGAHQSFEVDNFDGEFGAVLSTRKIQTIQRIPIDTRFVFHTVSGNLVPREIISIPVFSGKEIIAIISLASIRTYNNQSRLLINTINDTLSARIEGVLSYQKLQEIREKLEFQNSELEAQKTEMSAQSLELREQNRELEMQKSQLSEANRLKTNFLSNMSHELRTPLNSVIALTGVLIRRLVNKIPASEYGYLDVIERNGKHLLELINDILDISRIEAGKEEVDISKFTSNDLVSDVITMIQPQAKQKNIGLIQKESRNIIISSDVGKCRHILQNLIGNAVKFTEKGKVEVEVVKKDEKFEIVITDTGIGISEKHIGHIFDEFRQADGSTSRRYGGTGLGLAIAKKYANLLGGTISVESEKGKGSAFTLILPLNYSEENRVVEKVKNRLEIVPQPIEITLPSTDRKTILLVDDSEPAIIQMKDFMLDSGYTVVVAHDGIEALGIISKVMPDAIILDLMMPDVDGFQVLESIRNAEQTAHIPVLVLTAKQITNEDLKNLKRNNVHQLIQKGDVSKTELLSAVTNLFLKAASKAVNGKKNQPEIKGKPLILVVEDNADNMTTVRAIIGDRFAILEAVDGNEGIMLAKTHKPHLILMDIALPGIDGIQAFKAIRQQGQLAHIPVIALTASAMTTDRETILAHGFDAYIPKPIDEKELFKTIENILYGK